MFERLHGVVDELRALVGDLDPALLEVEVAAKLVGVFGEVERLGAAGRALAAKRVDDSGGWRRSGHRNAAAWMAATSGTTLGAAAAALEMAHRLKDAPATDAALRAGKLSIDQAREIAGAASANPAAELQLVQQARMKTVADLREQCRRIAAAGDEEVARDRRLYARRYCRTWTEHDGGFRLDARLMPADGGKLLAALEAQCEQIFRAARREGRREPREAYLADALVTLADGDGQQPTSRPSVVANIVIDHAAIARGKVDGNETCEIAGIGPISVKEAQRLAEDAWLNVLVTKGVDVVAVAHGGRTVTSNQRRALELRDPRCVAPGCGSRHGLQIHHVHGWAITRRTKVDELVRLCRAHHLLIHRGDFELGGTSGDRTWRSRSESADSVASSGRVVGDLGPPLLC